MKNKFLVTLLLICGLFALNAQEDEGVITGESDPSAVTTANSQITEVRLDGFEDASFWNVSMPSEEGIISRQSRIGNPAEINSDEWKERDEKYGIPDTYAKEKVFGVKVEYMKRGYHSFSITPVKPIIVEGIAQSITVWVAGRNYSHTLKFLIEDFYGNTRELIAEKLRFIGWKEIKVSIPESIIQRDFHFADKSGIRFVGFVVECDPMETYGTYYVYFDELRAETDIFNEKTRDPDDMVDGW